MELQTIIVYKSQLTKSSNSYNLLHNFFHYKYNNIPVAGDSTVEPGGHFDHSYAYIYEIIAEDFVVERPPLWFSFYFIFNALSKKES